MWFELTIVPLCFCVTIICFIISRSLRRRNWVQRKKWDSCDLFSGWGGREADIGKKALMLSQIKPARICILKWQIMQLTSVWLVNSFIIYKTFPSMELFLFGSVCNLVCSAATRSCWLAKEVACRNRPRGMGTGLQKFFFVVFLSFYFCQSLHFDFVTVSDCCFTVH